MCGTNRHHGAVFHLIPLDELLETLASSKLPLMAAVLGYGLAGGPVSGKAPPAGSKMTLGAQFKVGTTLHKLRRTI